MDHASHTLTGKDKLLFTSVGITAALMSIPYMAPLLHLGDTNMTRSVIGTCTALGGETGSGLAGAINRGIAHIPLIGTTLVGGGWEAMAVSGVIGLGGALLGNYIEKHYDKEDHIPWGKIIKYAAITTSILISMPSILGGISMGLTYLAFAIGSKAVSAFSVSQTLASSLGFMGRANMVAASSSLSGLIPHIFSCGAAAFPALGALFVPPPHMDDASEKAPLAMKLVATDPIISGQPCNLAFQLTDKQTGKILGPDALEVMHTKKLHTMIVDASLTDYHHLHPQYDPSRQLFTCSFTPKLNQPYRAWHDLTRAETQENIHLSNDLPAPRTTAIRPHILPSQTATTGDVTITLDPSQLRAASSSMLNIEARDPQGRLLTDLEPIMGAYAHLVGFSEDGKHLIHCHPTGHQPTRETDRGTGNLQFHITPETSGNTKFFLQIHRHGEDITIPFGQRIQPPAKFTERVSQPAHTHQMAMG